MYPRLRGKIVLMFSTGASAGFGEASARSFASCGSHLVLGARRLDRLKTLQGELTQKYSVKVHVDALDVTSWESVTSFLKNIPEDLSAIDILINNAGLALGIANVVDTNLASFYGTIMYFIFSPLTRMQKDAYTMLDTNVKGALHMIKAVLPGMTERKRGHIINISSIAGLESYRGGSMYCASKHALEAMNTALRKELVATPLRVTSIQPGLCEGTEFSVVRFNGDVERAKNVYKGIQAVMAADVADNILYAAAQPPHVQIAQLTVLATNQASSEIIHRETA